MPFTIILKYVPVGDPMPIRVKIDLGSKTTGIALVMKRRGTDEVVWSMERTKFNRTTQGYPKAHWIDAACVGKSGAPVRLDPEMVPLTVKAMGRGSRQMCWMNKYGFPRTVHGFRTGDLVRADVPKGKPFAGLARACGALASHAGIHVGYVVVRTTGSFNVGGVDGICWKYCRLLQRGDGYRYRYFSNSSNV